jgi:two-component system phosphate regulon response regulator PhoB
MSKKRILIVEDERDMADLVAKRLVREGFLVDLAYDGVAGLGKMRARPPDLALVDIMLPHTSGLDLVKEVRHDPLTAHVPIILLTAKADESDIVVGLTLGADDYVTKPFSMSVLVARVHAVLRRAAAGTAENAPVKVGSIAIDTDRHRVTVAGEVVTLTLTEFRLLLALATARGRVLTRNQLIDKAMGTDHIVTDRTIDVHLTALRRKLGAASDGLQTVRGVGYRLVPEDERDEETA